MAEGIKYAPHLNTSIKDQIKKWTGDNDADVFQYTNRGIIHKEAIFLNKGTYATVSRKGKIQSYSYYPYIDTLLLLVEPLDSVLTPFGIRSLITRPISWMHKKLKPESYEDVDLQEFGKELDEHGGIDFLQVVSPSRAGQVDYIRCADGQKYVLRKKERKILRL